MYVCVEKGAWHQPQQLILRVHQLWHHCGMTRSAPASADAFKLTLEIAFEVPKDPTSTARMHADVTHAGTCTCA